MKIETQSPLRILINDFRLFFVNAFICCLSFPNFQFLSASGSGSPECSGQAAEPRRAHHLDSSASNSILLTCTSSTIQLPLSRFGNAPVEKYFHLRSIFIAPGNGPGVISLYFSGRTLRTSSRSSGTGIGDPSKAFNIISTTACLIVVPRITQSALKRSRISRGIPRMKMETSFWSFCGLFSLYTVRMFQI